MWYTTIRHFVLLFLLLLTGLTNTQAQNNTHSPFSVIGIGEIEMRDFGRTAAMGNTGIGLQSENFLNRRNPAALTRIDTLKFIIDVSAAFKLSEFKSGAKSHITNNFNFKTLAAGVRLSSKWTSSVGLKPVSSVGYNMKAQQYEEGSVNTYKDFFSSGEGGINSFYWAHAYEFFNGFSLGATVAYMFGNITHNRNIDAMSEVTRLNISKLHFDLGMQYSYWFGDHTNVMVGAIYIPQSKFDIQPTKTVTSGMLVERNQRLPDTRSYMPESYGAGFAIMRNQNNSEWIVSADYQFSNRSVLGSRYSDSHLYTAGIQLTPNVRRPESYLQVIRFMLGGSYNRSYLTMKENQLEDYSLSVGAGFPFTTQFSTISYVNVAITAGESFLGGAGGITERYLLFSVNMSLIDRWFAKRQWD